MCATCGKKQTILRIKSVLERYTDSEHRLSQTEIAGLVSQDYGLAVDRKTVARNLTALSDLGVDIGLEGGVYLACRPVLDGTAVAAALLGLALPEELISPTARAACFALGPRQSAADTEKLAVLAGAIEAGDRISFVCPPSEIRGYHPRAGRVTLRPCALYWAEGRVRLAAESPSGAPCSVPAKALTQLSRISGRHRFTKEEREALLTALTPKQVTVVLLCSEGAAERFAALGGRSDPADGGYRVTICAPLDQIVELALITGAKILSPKTAKEAIVDRIIALADQYTE